MNKSLKCICYMFPNLKFTNSGDERLCGWKKIVHHLQIFWTEIIVDGKWNLNMLSLLFELLLPWNIKDWIWVLECHLGPLRNTHETEGPWPSHFKHSLWWKRWSRTKFASHYARGTNRVCECTMDVKSTWIFRGIKWIMFHGHLGYLHTPPLEVGLT